VELKYTYKQDGKFFVGFLDEYPEYPTQGLSLTELEDNLEDIHNMIKTGALEGKNHGVLKVAG
jgi:predicted RNase H-like HicB family nuclease